jgi:protein-S-isoprenylcysteine O-methyltransferase Ste14
VGDRLPAVIPARVLARWRVPLGWALGLAALYWARPSNLLYAAGVVVGLLGEAIRLWAAGHLDKDQALTRSGPYRWTRNPLYFGSLLVGTGFALATGLPLLVLVVGLLFALVYAPVMRREARRLSERHGEAYREFAARVPLFWPSPPELETAKGAFQWSRARRNGEVWTLLGVVLVALILGAKLLIL